MAQSEAAHNNRLRRLFLYEEQGLTEGAAVYNGLPSTHRDYWGETPDGLRTASRLSRPVGPASPDDRDKPLETPPDGLTAEQLKEYNDKKLLWQQQHDAWSRTSRAARRSSEAELVVIDAADEAENAREPSQRFAAATAAGACRVVLAGMEADAGNADKAMI